MSRTINEFMTVYCNACGKPYHPKYGKELESRFCSKECSMQKYADKKYILQARLRSKVNIVDGCWVWTGSKNVLGYGFIRVGTHNVRAHRASYTAFKGEIPEGLYVCHTCDNPQCINPDHLFAGTPAENTTDMIAKGRKRLGPPLRGERHPRCKLTIDQAREIKSAKGTARELAAKYGVSHALIVGIRNGTNWRYI